MFRTRTHLLIWGMAMVLMAVETKSQEGVPRYVPWRSTPPQIASAKELWDKARSLGLLSPPPPVVTPPVASDGPYWWFTTFLGSKDGEVRDAAAEIVAESTRPFGVESVLPYLGPENPTNVRMAALRWAMSPWHFGKDHGRRDESSIPEEQRNRERKATTEAFNDLFKADVTPPFSAQVLFGGSGLTIAESLQPLVARRVLAAYSSCVAGGGMGSPTRLEILSGMDAAIVAREAAAWYKIEPSPTVRKDMLRWIRVGDMKALKPLYEVGMKDWNTDNAKLARSQLEESLRSRRGPGPTSQRIWGPRVPGMMKP